MATERLHPRALSVLLGLAAFTVAMAGVKGVSGIIGPSFLALVLIEALVSMRTVNVGLLRALPDDAWEQTVVHAEAGDQSVEFISTMFGDHVADHLRDVENAGLHRAAQ